jgi:membrane protease YdiL (CAAX protease family)
MLSPQRILLIALITQGGLVALAWWCARLLGLPSQWGTPARDATIGLVAAASLAAANYLLLTRAPDNWLVDGVRTTYRETIVPLFGGMHPLGVIVLGAAAGVGEEWLFRGVVQPLTGLVVSSILFGAAHVGSWRMLPFGVWATGMGVIMGALAIATGGLVAPMVAHGVYDMLALEYIRRGARNA